MPWVHKSTAQRLQNRRFAEFCCGACASLPAAPAIRAMPSCRTAGVHPEFRPRNSRLCASGRTTAQNTALSQKLPSPRAPNRPPQAACVLWERPAINLTFRAFHFTTSPRSPGWRPAGAHRISLGPDLHTPRATKGQSPTLSCFSSPSIRLDSQIPQLGIPAARPCGQPFRGAVAHDGQPVAPTKDTLLAWLHSVRLYELGEPPAQFIANRGASSPPSRQPCRWPRADRSNFPPSNTRQCSPGLPQRPMRCTRIRPHRRRHARTGTGAGGHNPAKVATSAAIHGRYRP